MSYDPVVLIHGLWMKSLVMRPLGWRLQRCGFRPHYFSYPSTRANPVQNADALNRLVGKIPGSRVHFVCHSLGGLVALHMLARHADQRPGRLVLLGSPVQGSAVAADMVQKRLWRGVLGKSIEQGLLEGAPGHPCDRELGLVAGTMGVGMGRLFTTMEAVHDGAVNLSETRLPGATDHIAIHTTHSGLLVSPKVARQVCFFLKNGQFCHD